MKMDEESVNFKLKLLFETTVKHVHSGLKEKCPYSFRVFLAMRDMNSQTFVFEFSKVWHGFVFSACNPRVAYLA